MAQNTEPIPALRAGSLGNYGNNCGGPAQEPDFGPGFCEPASAPGASRRAALALRERLWSVSSIADVRKCGRVPRERMMPLLASPGGYRLTGLCTCHSVWVCPICAPEIRSARGVQIAGAVGRRIAEGGAVTFGTGTLSHAKAHALRTTYSLVVSAWHGVTMNTVVRKFREAHGWWGFIRTTEMTYTANGWHPHMHWLDFWEVPLAPWEVAEYQDVVFAAWSRTVGRLSDRKASAGRGVLLLPVTGDGVDIGNYLTDMSPRSASFELTAISTKEARRGGLAPFELLAKVYGPGSKPWVDLWWEYEQATRGRKMLGKSRRLFDRLGLSDDDPEPAELGEVAAYVSADDWSRIRWFTENGLAGVQAVLEEAAKGGQVAVDAAVGLLLGLPVDAPGVPPDSVQGEWFGPGDDGGKF